MRVDKLIEKNSWIASEKQLFGRSGTDYDFATRDPCVAREEFEGLQAEQSRFVPPLTLCSHLITLKIQ